jgi:twitching motility protein PilT
MDTLRIDEWLQTVCTREAIALHLAVGNQPVMHLHGQAHPMAAEVLNPGDTLALMRSITPERCQQELREVGRTDFGFAFGERARFRVAVSERRGNIGLVLQRIPIELPTDTLGGATRD